MTKEELLKEYKEELAKEGLPLAEDAILKFLDVTEKMLAKYADSTASKIDDMAVPLLHPIFNLAKQKFDKIDGVVG
jgi:hypothetical protein